MVNISPNLCDTILTNVIRWLQILSVSCLRRVFKNATLALAQISGAIFIVLVCLNK